MIGAQRQSLEGYFRIQKGCENSQKCDRSLSRVPSGCEALWDGPRGFRCAPTPGYLLLPLWGIPTP